MVADLKQTFRQAVESFGQKPVLILGHNDADGLSAIAILVRALEHHGIEVQARIVGRGESPWSDAMRTELAEKPIGGLIITDLGVCAGQIRQDVPTIIIDHHVPRGRPQGAVVLSGFIMDPIPTSSLLAYWCASTLQDVDDLLWLAACGLIGDGAENYGFAEMVAARAKYGVSALRAAAALINQPRRSRSGHADAALALLLKAEGPKDVTSGKLPETRQLIADREEVRIELEKARKTAPKFAGEVALIRFASPCQVHPLVAQAWAGRLKNQIVIAANTGYREGWVHFAARSAADRDLVAFFRSRAPEGADENYGGGHRRASGGALRIQDWNTFVRSLGFGSEMEVSE